MLRSTCFGFKMELCGILGFPGWKRPGRGKGLPAAHLELSFSESRLKLELHSFN